MEDNPSEDREIQIALCLSGGGFRASLFHLGVLRRLHECGLLKDVRVISAVSGGAITAALFQQHCGGLSRDTGGLKYQWDEFENALLAMTSRGILHHFYASFLLWISLIAFVATANFYPFGWAWIGSGLISGLLYIHLIRACLQANKRCREQEILWNKLNGTSDHIRWTPFRTYLVPFVPSEMRVATMINGAFGAELIGMLHSRPLMCLSAVDLISGKQKVLSNSVFAELSDQGTAALWDGRPDEDNAEQGHLSLAEGEMSFSSSYDARTIPVARAVAASTAIPPIFSHVPMRKGETYLGSLVDGGVLDNLGVNPIVQLSYSISDRRQKYNTVIGGAEPFKDVITHILMVDAGARSPRKIRPYILRTNLLRRVVNVMLSHQEAESERKIWLLEGVSETPVQMLGLHVGYPVDADLQDTRWGRVLGSVRTHLDGFRKEESACLMYSGYCWADYWISQNFDTTPQDADVLLPRAPRAGFGAFLPGAEDTSSDEGLLLAIVGRSGLGDGLKRFLVSLFP